LELNDGSIKSTNVWVIFQNLQSLKNTYSIFNMW
jgi:hypothetical protein